MTFKEKSDFQILKLADAFYEAYPNPPFKEIMTKRQRAYDCLLLQTEKELLVCIPYAYHFKKSARSRKFRSGLDYSKAVIIRNMEYISGEDDFPS